MPHGRLEHVNITVSDPDRSARLLRELCGWHERWRGPSAMGGSTIHVGGDTDYVALYSLGRPTIPFAKSLPLNHVGILVDDLDAAQRVVAAAGLEPGSYEHYAPGRRFYFLDWDGIEFEIVSYT